MEIVGTRPKSPGLYAVVEDYPPSETARVAVKVGRFDGLEDGGAVVLLGHLFPPLEIALELLGETDNAWPRSGRGDHVVEFSKVEPCHKDGEVQELCLSCQSREGLDRDPSLACGCRTQ